MSELSLALFRNDRDTVSAPVAAGAATIEFPALSQNTLAEIEMVSVSGPAIGGARVTLYRDEATPEKFMGSVLLGASDPGTTFVDARPWLFGLERLVVVVTGSAGDRVSATVWQRLYVQKSLAAPSIAAADDGEEH